MVTPRKGFTLIELLIVIAVIAILSVVVVLVLNPAELLKQSRDANRLSDLATLVSAINFYNVNQNSASGNLGSVTALYVSTPDAALAAGATSTCPASGLPTGTLASGHSFVCASSKTGRNVNGTGWIPIDFTKISAGSPLGSLPVDPTNATSSSLYYTYSTDGTKYEVTANLESTKQKPVEAGDGGAFLDLAEKGTSFTLMPNDYGATAASHGIWAAEWNDGKILKFDTSGHYIQSFGSFGTGPGQISDLEGIAADASGDIYAVDAGSYRIVKFDPKGNYIKSFGSFGTGDGQFSYPYFIAIDGSGNVYVPDCGSDPPFRVEKFDADGNYITKFGQSGPGAFSCPTGLTFDANGNIYVGDAHDYTIKKFDANGNYISAFGSEGTGNGQFDGFGPAEVGVDLAGDIWVNDNWERFEKFDANGNYILQFTAGSVGGMAMNPAGDLYVLDTADDSIEEFDASGNLMTTFANGGGANPWNWNTESGYMMAYR